MEEMFFEEQINTHFSADRIRQDENRPGAIVPVSEPTASTMEDVLFSEVPMRSITEPVEVMEDTTILQGTPLATTIPSTAPLEKPAGIIEDPLTALLSQNESAHFRSRWNEIQGMFVDDPRTAVQQADELVSDVIEMVTRIFSDEHNTLEDQWKEGSDVSTEDLRQALQHYRTFFNRLVV